MALSVHQSFNVVPKRGYQRTSMRSASKMQEVFWAQNSIVKDMELNERWSAKNIIYCDEEANCAARRGRTCALKDYCLRGSEKDFI